MSESSDAEEAMKREKPLDMSELVKPSQRIFFEDADTHEEFFLYQITIGLLRRRHIKN